MISVVFAHYNRPEYLRRTLYAYKCTHEDLSNVEFIIIDDESEIPADKVYQEFKNTLNMKYIMQHYNKKPLTSCIIAMNLGAQYASGEILVIANPESLPIGPILEEIERTIELNKYISVRCYATDPAYQKFINDLDCTSPDFVKNIIYSIRLKRHNTDGIYKGDAWYNHPIYRPAHYHFTSAIMRQDYIDMGGFDEDFIYGTGRDDVDFIRRLEVKGMNLQYSSAIVLHQYHYHDSWIIRGTTKEDELINTALYEQRKKEMNWKAGSSLLYQGEINGK